MIAHLAELGLTGPDCVLIGDSVDDAHAADAVGAGCVLYSGGFTDCERLRATGKLVARSLSAAVELIYAWLPPSHASSIRIRLPLWALPIVSRTNRVLPAGTSINCTPRALDRLPVFTVFQVVPLPGPRSPP